MHAKNSVINHVRSHSKIYIAITVIASLALLLTGVAGAAAFAGVPGLAAISATAIGLPYAMIGVGLVGIGGTVVVLYIGIRLINSSVSSGIEGIESESDESDDVTISNFLNTLENVDQSHVKGINGFLKNRSFNYLEHYGFYYHLASITEHVLQQEPVKSEDWQQSLKQIHRKKFTDRYEITIDCSIEFARLNKELPEITIKELKREEVTNNDLTQINTICHAAFDDWPYNGDLDGVKSYFFQKNSTPYVMRNSLTNDVLGIIVLLEKNNTTLGDKKLYIHTLARVPHAVKLGMTKKLKVHFNSTVGFEKYSKIYCKVEPDNNPAQYIYKQLGFKQVECPRNSNIVMVYDMS